MSVKRINFCIQAAIQIVDSQFKLYFVDNINKLAEQVQQAFSGQKNTLYLCSETVIFLQMLNRSRSSSSKPELRYGMEHCAWTHVVCQLLVPFSHDISVGYNLICPLIEVWRLQERHHHSSKRLQPSPLTRHLTYKRSSLPVIPTLVTLSSSNPGL